MSRLENQRAAGTGLRWYTVLNLDLVPAGRAELARAVAIRDRLIALNRQAAELILQNGLLLKEIKDNAIYREWGYESFDEAIERMNEDGALDYGSRQARNFILIVEMTQRQGLGQSDIEGVSISKLREIATVHDPGKQMQMLKAAPDMSVKQVQQEARKARDKELGRDVDPLHPVTLMFTETQRTLYYDAVAKAKIVFSFDDNTNPANVVEAILAEFMASADQQILENMAAAQGTFDEPSAPDDPDDLPPIDTLLE